MLSYWNIVYQKITLFFLSIIIGVATNVAFARDCAPTGQRLYPVPVAASGEITLASQNLEEFFDDIKEGAAKKVSAQEYQWRTQKLANQIVNNLREPDVIAVQEAENKAVLLALIAEMRQKGGKKLYQVQHYKGPDSGGHHSGYLVRADWKILAVEPLMTDLRLETGGKLFDRPPLRIRVRSTNGFTFDVVNVHLKSMYGSDKPKKAATVALKREQQAIALAAWIRNRLGKNQDPPLVVLGDFNATPDVLGGVDVLGYIQPTGLQWALALLPEDERYSYVYKCEPEALDHAYFSKNLNVKRVAFSRGNSGVGKKWAEESTSALRSSDHDGLVLYIRP